MKLGFISFGGPAGQIAVTHEALVERHRWISENRFGRATAMRLHAAGIEARFLRGGIDGWKAAGKPLLPKGGTRGG